jgi:riboflavin kinase/FMN adenylyltransferase
LKSYSTFENSRIKSAAIGSFDGMHYAHQKLFDRLIKNAGIIIVIDKGTSNLTPNFYREYYTKFPILYMELSDIKNLTPLEFIYFLEDMFPNLEKLVVGYDFRFGKDRACCSNELRLICDLKVDVVNRVELNNQSVHSTYIRDYIKSGDIKKANLFLGRYYTIFGFQVRGQGIGSKELVSTINIKLKDNFLIPKEGVYITYTTIFNVSMESVTFIGSRDSTDSTFAIETHILNKNIESESNIKDVKIEFVEYIRENMKFDSLKSLKSQISKDITNAKRFFEKNG